MKTRVRVARLRDVPAVLAIENDVFDHPWPPSAFTEEFENDVSVLKVIEDGAGVAGYYDLWVCADEAHLLNVAVARDRQRLGYGETLVRDAIKTARAKEAATLFLEVMAGNAAAANLYLKLGFVKISVRRKYYENGEDADVMALYL